MTGDKTKRRVILFNGPKRVGKDTATDVALRLCHDLGIPVYSLKVAEPLKSAFHVLHGFDGVPADFFEKVKDQPVPELGGMKPRDGYIDLSENYVKPKYGDDHFGKVAVTRIKRLAEGVVVISDCGFDAEVAHISAAFGEENVHLIRLYRPDHDFEPWVEGKGGDSRGYVSHTYEDGEIRNDGTLEQFQDEVREDLTWLFKEFWKIA